MGKTFLEFPKLESISAREMEGLLKIQKEIQAITNWIEAAKHIMRPLVEHYRSKKTLSQPEYELIQHELHTSFINAHLTLTTGILMMPALEEFAQETHNLKDFKALLENLNGDISNFAMQSVMPEKSEDNPFKLEIWVSNVHNAQSAVKFFIQKFKNPLT